MSIKLKGSTDGSVTLQAPADTSPTGTDKTLTLPTTTGSANQFVKNGGTAGELEYSSMVEDSTGDVQARRARSNTAGDVALSVQPSDSTIHYGLRIDATNNSLNLDRASGTPANLLTIDSSGRLLVGTGSSNSGPQGLQAALQVEGTGADTSAISITRNSANGSPPYLNFGKSRGTSTGSNTSVSNGDTIGAITFNGSDGSGTFGTFAEIRGEAYNVVGNGDHPGALRFFTTPDGSSTSTERIRIESSGRIGLGPNNAGSTVVCSTTQGAGTSYAVLSGTHSATNPVGGTISIRIWNNGNIQNTNNSYGSLSDSKLKENIVDANSQWDDIKDIRVRNYNFIEGETHTQLGVVAQEVETVSPGLVYETPDTDDDGNDLGTVTKSVNYSVLYMKAVKALQEAQTRIETLETQYADLLARVTALEAA